jgi:hypothetical protein
MCACTIYATCCLLQIATLDFTDAFVRARAHPATVLDTYSVVELWMGTARVYTCYDSLATATVGVTVTHPDISSYVLPLLLRAVF